MKVFLNANILPEFFVEDRPASIEALEIFKSIRNGAIEALTSAISIANCLYVLDVSYRVKNAPKLIMAIIDLLFIQPTSNEIIKQALTSNFNDKDDALQYFSALGGRSDLIVTNDTKGFAQNDMPVATPHQFVTQHLKK